MEMTKFNIKNLEMPLFLLIFSTNSLFKDMVLKSIRNKFNAKEITECNRFVESLSLSDGKVFKDILCD